MGGLDELLVGVLVGLEGGSVLGGSAGVVGTWEVGGTWEEEGSGGTRVGGAMVGASNELE